MLFKIGLCSDGTLFLTTKQGNLPPDLVDSILGQSVPVEEIEAVDHFAAADIYLATRPWPKLLAMYRQTAPGLIVNLNGEEEAYFKQETGQWLDAHEVLTAATIIAVRLSDLAGQTFSLYIRSEGTAFTVGVPGYGPDSRDFNQVSWGRWDPDGNLPLEPQVVVFGQRHQPEPTDIISLGLARFDQPPGKDIIGVVDDYLEFRLRQEVDLTLLFDSAIIQSINDCSSVLGDRLIRILEKAIAKFTATCRPIAPPTLATLEEHLRHVYLQLQGEGAPKPVTSYQIIDRVSLNVLRELCGAASDDVARDGNPVREAARRLAANQSVPSAADADHLANLMYAFYRLGLAAQTNTSPVYLTAEKVIILPAEEETTALTGSKVKFVFAHTYMTIDEDYLNQVFPAWRIFYAGRIEEDCAEISNA